MKALTIIEVLRDTIEEDEAKRRGAHPCAGPYLPTTQESMLWRALEDFKAAKRLAEVVIVWEFGEINGRWEKGLSIWTIATTPTRKAKTMSAAKSKSSSGLR